MSTAAVDAGVRTRLLEEGYGPGAWHGPDLKAALSDVSSKVAFWRPAKGRHNIAEIALHHAWYARSVAARLSGKAPESFPLEGEDWFELSDESRLSWAEVSALVAEQQRLLAQVVGDIDAGRVSSALPEREQFNLALGITCHAVYHAGQVQLLKVLGAGAPRESRP